MKRKKINIGAISTTLSRSEMRKIMAGSDQGGGGGGTGGCYAGCSCGSGCQQASSGVPGFTGCTETYRADGCLVCSYSGGVGSCTG